MHRGSKNSTPWSLTHIDTAVFSFACRPVPSFFIRRVPFLAWSSASQPFRTRYHLMWGRPSGGAALPPPLSLFISRIPSTLFIIAYTYIRVCRFGQCFDFFVSKAPCRRPRSLRECMSDSETTRAG